MNRLIFLASTAIAAIILASSVFFPATDATASPDVSEGFALWQGYGCESCHTLFGQGGNYAPDLTQIYTLRGETYIQDFMVHPAAYHPGQRLMPRFTINQTEITQLIAMLEWTANQQPVADTFPPNPIQVAGTGGLNVPSAMTASDSETVDPVLARGQEIYSQRCASCHSIAEDVVILGPSFWNVANTAANRVEGQTAAAYIRNSILNPSDYVLAGFQDVMAKNLAEQLSSDDIDAVIAYLLTFDGERTQ